VLPLSPDPSGGDFLTIRVEGKRSWSLTQKIQLGITALGKQGGKDKGVERFFAEGISEQTLVDENSGDGYA
jgi:hypothetical protein